jgi:hypothetical protein
MALQVNNIIAKHGLNTHVLGYVKDEGSNLSTMIYALTYVVPCEVLELPTFFYRGLLGPCNVQVY